MTFALPYANTGGATAHDVIIQDRVPAGMTLYEPGTGAYNGSILINGVPGDPGNAAQLEILDSGRTLRFHLGNVKAGKIGFVLYKARVLGPDEAGAPSVDSVLTSTGSVISSDSLKNTYIGQPDGRDITVTGKYAYYLEPTQYSSNTTGPDQGVTYETRYLNTGTKASKVLEIDVPVPAGMAYVGAELYDLNHQALPGNGIQDGAVMVPANPASGTVVFRPPLFTASGKVGKGEGGIIREFFQPLPNALANGYRVFIHAPTIAASSYGTASAFSPGSARPQKAGGPTTRGDAAPATADPTNATRVDDPSIPRLFIALALPMSMTEGQTSEVFVAAGSLNGQPLNDFASGELIFTLPPGVQFGEGEVGTDPAFFSTQTNAAGLTQVQVSFANGLAANGAAVAKFTVKPQSGTASPTPLVFPGCALGFDPRSPVALQTGPVKVRVLNAAEAAQLSDRFHLLAPDYPGFGNSDAPPPTEFAYSFDQFADIIEQFLEALHVKRYSFYMQGYGAPIGFRLASRYPERIQVLIIQNANAYEEGYTPAWAPFRALWQDRNPETEAAMAALFAPKFTQFFYREGAQNPDALNPDAWNMDQVFLDRAANQAANLEIFYDFRKNLPLVDQWHAYFRKHQPPALIVWGERDPFFTVAGARAYLRDLPKAELHLLPTGHTALEEQGAAIAEHIRRFLPATPFTAEAKEESA